MPARFAEVRAGSHGFPVSAAGDAMTDRNVARSLRGYQAEAVAAISAGLGGGGRRQLRAACGTGKTFIASVVAAELAGGGVTVVLVPSIALAAQTITDWYAGWPGGPGAGGVLGLHGRGRRGAGGGSAGAGDHRCRGDRQVAGRRPAAGAGGGDL